MSILRSALALLVAVYSVPALSANAAEYLQREQAAAVRENPNFSPSGDRGARFFTSTHGSDRSCAFDRGHQQQFRVARVSARRDAAWA